MAERLTGKVALITGAASGIGRATALLFAREGARVVVADRNLSGSEQTVSEIQDQGGEAIAVRVEVTEATQMEAAIEAALDKFGQLNILFNNAGTGETATSIMDLAEDEWDRVMAVNVKGVFLGIKYGAPAMVKAGQGGSIINTASVAGLVGYAGHAAYSASKAACVHLSKTAALELAKSNIRVNAIAPSFTATPMVEELAASSRDPERAMKKLAQANPLGRLGTPEEIANAALFLASDESSFVTGTVLTLDGGLTAQ
jgi:NAD(P)-dependent dehydrogenase (short-subunit alcohol dehydrogenase family)